MSKNKPDKYLTEMKELPPSYSPDEKREVSKEESKQDKPKEDQKQEDKVIKEEKKELKMPEKPGKSPKVERPLMSMSDEADDVEEKGEHPYTYKDVILGVVNLLSVIFFVIMIVNFPKKSQELKNLKIQEIKNEMAANMETNEIDLVKPKVEKIDNYFLDEAGIVNFVNDVELQKSEGGAISKVSFASQKAVADKTGNYGVPIVIELTGGWEVIDSDLQKIDKLPYLFRPVKVEIEYDEENPDEENPKMVVYKYGIFLYVRESLGKN